MESIETIKNLVFPKAVLRPLTNEAREAVDRTCLPDDMIGIWSFPFKVGRESRIGLQKGAPVIMERKKADDHKPNNDFYLFDVGSRLQISREHFYIDFINQEYFLVDRESACGTNVNLDSAGGKDKGGKLKLKHGDQIKIGTSESKYIFEFFILV